METVDSVSRGNSIYTELDVHVNVNPDYSFDQVQIISFLLVNLIDTLVNINKHMIYENPKVIN